MTTLLTGWLVGKCTLTVVSVLDQISRITAEIGRICHPRELDEAMPASRDSSGCRHAPPKKISEHYDSRHTTDNVDCLAGR